MSEDSFPYASEKELEEGEKYYETIDMKLPEPEKGFSKKEVILDVVNQLRKTPQFFRISIPIVFISPMSFLEMIGLYLTPTPSLVTIASCKKKEERFLRVVKWALSNLSRKITKGFCHSKPFNPVIGEQFIWKWNHHDSTTCCIAEQVSHHPPIGAYYVSNRKKNFSCRTTIQPISKLYANSFELQMPGEINFHVHNYDEEYSLYFPPFMTYGILFGKQFSEMYGVYKIECPKNKLTFIMLLKEKEENKIVGRIIYDKDGQNEKTLYKFSGKANQKILIKNMKTGKVSLFCNNENSKIHKIKPVVRPLKDQKDFESRRNWHMVTKHLRDNNLDAAHKHKKGIENAQRAKRKEREEKGIVHKPKYFEVFREDSIEVKRFEEQEKEEKEKLTLFKCRYENTKPYEEGEKDEFENLEIFKY